jgi:Xaa-Pro aminopeptidase
MVARRLEEVKQSIVQSRLRGLLVTSLPNIRYLTGFTGSNALLFISPETDIFITDTRYRMQAANEVKGFRVLIASGSLNEILSQKIGDTGRGKIGFEASALSVSAHSVLKKSLRKTTLVPLAGVVEKIRALKDEDEILNIRRAASITDKVFNKILAILKPGVRELEIAAEVAYWHKSLGAESDAFETLVASGARGALPHARPSEKKIRKSEMVTIDLGCRVEGYHCDMTRTVSVGRPSAELRKIHTVVLEAQQRSLDKSFPGTPVKVLDGAARGHIRKQGYGKYFTHSLGHGIGLEVHEMPRVSAKSTEILKSEFVITVEPGIYVPGLGGVRIEDDVIIREQGCELLSTVARELVIV